MTAAALFAATRRNLLRIPATLWLALVVVLSLTDAIDFSVASAARPDKLHLLVSIVVRIFIVFAVLVAVLRFLSDSPRPRWRIDASYWRYLGYAVAQVALGAVLGGAVKAIAPGLGPWGGALALVLGGAIALRFALVLVDAAHGAGATFVEGWRRLSGHYVTLLQAWLVAVVPLALLHTAVTIMAIRSAFGWPVLGAWALGDGLLSALLAAVLLSLQVAIWRVTLPDRGATG